MANFIKRNRFTKIEIVVDASTGYSNVVDGIWTVRNANAPVGLGQIWQGNPSDVHTLFQRLGFDVVFSYSPPRQT